MPSKKSKLSKENKRVLNDFLALEKRHFHQFIDSPDSDTEEDDTTIEEDDTTKEEDDTTQEEDDTTQEEEDATTEEDDTSKEEDDTTKDEEDTTKEEDDTTKEEDDVDEEVVSKRLEKKFARFWDKAEKNTTRDFVAHVTQRHFRITDWKDHTRSKHNSMFKTIVAVGTDWTWFKEWKNHKRQAHH